MLCNFLELETIKIQSLNFSAQRPKIAKQSKNGFFRVLQKLPRLKKVKLNTDEELIQDFRLEKELQEFYKKPHSFKFSIKIEAYSDFGKRLRLGLARILNAAEFLSLSDCKESRNRNDREYGKMTKETRRMKDGKKNCVRIFRDGKELDIIKILSHCDSLQHLYLKSEYDALIWEYQENKQQVKALQNVKSIGLEFSSFVIENYQEDQGEKEDDDDEKEYGVFASPLRTNLQQFKEKCPLLERFSLYLSTSEFLRLDWVLQECPTEEAAFRKSVNRLVQEISTFDKLKVFGLLIYPDDFHGFYFDKVLSNKSLESFQVKFHAETKGSHPDWENHFGLENNNRLKKLAITIPERKSIPLFRVDLLSYIQRLESLEVVELVDKNLEVIAFDFIHGLMMSLLEKINMKKILICKKVANNFYSEDFEMFLSKSVGTHLKNMLDEISQELESRVKTLKALRLEEILVGKWQDYGFGYLFYNKEMGVTEKIFWTEKEMKELLREKRELARRYCKEFELFNKKEEIKKRRFSEDKEESDRD